MYFIFKKTSLKQIFILMFVIMAFTVYPQEALKSFEEEYYDFLALQGIVKRPYLNYRSLSDSAWAADENYSQPWQEQNLGIKRQWLNNVFVRIYGPELFMSFNTAAPYGQNDGALWQGKGLNSSLTGGIRLETYGIELTFKPQFTFSQNMSFNLLPSAYDSEYSYFWAYGFNSGADAPQRFGNKPFFTFDWGDSEIRYTWKTLTIGFGTQWIWLGPSEVNSIIHSNNAPTYPKADIGLRKQRIVIPWVNWYLGDIEFRLWAGCLQESDYFDNNDDNDFNLFSGLSMAFSPSFLPGFSIFYNRTYNSKFIPESAETVVELFRFFRTSGGSDVWDQHITAGFEYLLPLVALDIYAEIGYNDTPGTTMSKLIKNISHTLAFTAGLKKGIPISTVKNIYSEILFEYSHLEMTPFYSQFYSSNSFYMHHQITQGYTNKGQWLGAGIGTGGNSQYLGFKVYYPKGFSKIFLYRYNTDNDFLVRETTPHQGYPSGKNLKTHRERTYLTIGLEDCYFLTKNLSLLGEISFSEIFSALYDDTNLHNFHLALNVILHL
jgi:hypothetical protein